MKILLVIDQFDQGNNGTTISARRFAQALAADGNEVRVAAAGKPARGKYPMPEIHFLPVADSIIRSQGMVFAKPNRSVLEQAIAWADVVHFMMPFALSRVGLRIAKEMGKPVTAAFHVQPENITSTIHLGKNKKANELLYEWFRDDFYNEFTHIHCPSPFIAGQLKEHGYQAKLHIISNGVSDEFYPRVRQKEPELAHKFVILMIGRYSEEKRQDVLIEAVKRSAHSHRIQLILAGQGPKERSLRWQGRSLRYPPIMGFFDTERLCELMAMSDLYVHAAETEESMNQKMQEEPKWKRTWHFIRPTVISVAVVLLAFFIMQGRPLATTLDRRTDLVSVVVTQNGAEQAFTDQDNIVRAAEVAGVLSRRFKTTQEHEPDTCYVFTFQNGRELKIGVYENDIYYDGQWYTGAASTPDLFRSMTGSRFFVIETTMPEMESTAE